MTGKMLGANGSNIWQHQNRKRHVAVELIFFSFSLVSDFHCFQSILEIMFFAGCEYRRLEQINDAFNTEFEDRSCTTFA